jgi:hypothetical protein
MIPSFEILLLKWTHFFFPPIPGTWYLPLHPSWFDTRSGILNLLYCTISLVFRVRVCSWFNGFTFLKVQQIDKPCWTTAQSSQLLLCLNIMIMESLPIYRYFWYWCHLLGRELNFEYSSLVKMSLIIVFITETNFSYGRCLRVTNACVVTTLVRASVPTVITTNYMLQRLALVIP